MIRTLTCGCGARATSAPGTCPQGWGHCYQPTGAGGSVRVDFCPTCLARHQRREEAHILRVSDLSQQLGQ